MRWRFRLPGRTLRARLTILYSALFLVSGALVLLIANVGVRTSDVALVPVPGRATPRGLPMPPEMARRATADRLVDSSILALVSMALVSVALGWVVSGRALAPLRTITSTAREISASNLHRRLGIAGPTDEITELGATLDDLFGRLQSSFESQRHFVANASHELRTPLTAERAVLQVALADPAASVVTLRAACEEVLVLGAQQERLIGALLALATGERGIERREAFDLAEVVATVVDDRRPEAERCGVVPELALAPAVVDGDRSLVESLVANLVDNAIRHNLAPDAAGADRARIEVSTWTAPADRDAAGGARLRVVNTGPIVAPGEVQRLFRPFERAGEARVGGDVGHGLGLAIVAAIVESHGGTLGATPRPGGGLDVTVAFPAGRNDSMNGP